MPWAFRSFGISQKDKKKVKPLSMGFFFASLLDYIKLLGLAEDREIWIEDPRIQLWDC